MQDQDPDEEELEKRLQALLGESPSADHGRAEPELAPEPPEDEIEARFKAVSDRLDQAQANRKLPDVPEWNPKRPERGEPKGSDSANYKGLGYGISIGYTLVGCMVLGWGIGWVIDRRVGGGGNTYQAFMALGGCVVGIGMAFWMMNRQGSQ